MLLGRGPHLVTSVWLHFLLEGLFSLLPLFRIFSNKKSRGGGEYSTITALTLVERKRVSKQCSRGGGNAQRISRVTLPHLSRHLWHVLYASNLHVKTQNKSTQNVTR